MQVQITVILSHFCANVVGRCGQPLSGNNSKRKRIRGWLIQMCQNGCLGGLNAKRSFFFLFLAPEWRLQNDSRQNCSLSVYSARMAARKIFYKKCLCCYGSLARVQQLKKNFQYFQRISARMAAQGYSVTKDDKEEVAPEWLPKGFQRHKKMISARMAV